MTHHHLLVVSTRTIMLLVLLVLLGLICSGLGGGYLGYQTGYSTGSIKCPDISTSQIGYPDGHVACAIAERPSPAAVIAYHRIRKSR